VVGEPQDVGGARALFEQDPFQFQFWAVSLLEAQPQDQSASGGRGADRGIERFFFLGADTLYGIACEAMLKMKEMSLSYSEAYHTLEFRHGPMSMAAENALVVGLISAEAARQELQVLREMRRLGAQTLSIAPFATDSPRHIALPDDLPVWNAPVLYLPVLQLLAYHRAQHNGQNPDRPQNLSAVISLADL